MEQSSKDLLNYAAFLDNLEKSIHNEKLRLVGMLREIAKNKQAEKDEKWINLKMKEENNERN